VRTTATAVRMPARATVAALLFTLHTCRRQYFVKITLQLYFLFKNDAQHVRPQVAEYRPSRPLWHTQAANRRISTTVGDHVGIPAAVRFYSFCFFGPFRVPTHKCIRMYDGIEKDKSQVARCVASFCTCCSYGRLPCWPHRCLAPLPGYSALVRHPECFPRSGSPATQRECRFVVLAHIRLLHCLISASTTMAPSGDAYNVDWRCTQRSPPRQTTSEGQPARPGLVQHEQCPRRHPPRLVHQIHPIAVSAR
jgi:hypothetical protein